jgi:hypothetical protein
MSLNLAILALVVIAHLHHIPVVIRWLRNRNHLQIVCVEPSPFRRGESYVLGPFNIYRAWRVANREVAVHPFAEALVVRADNQLVAQGSRILWDTRHAERT